MKALQISNLKKVYKNGFHALNNINIDVEEGDFFALLGPNGAGKSTIIGIITSLIKKSSGTVRIFGKDAALNPYETKSLIGVMPQEINFSQFEKPLDIILNQGGFYGINRKVAYQLAEKYLSTMGLWEQRNNLSRTLSGGFKRRLMVARALIHKPKLLFLDEPTAGVDIESRRAMWEFLVDVNKQGTTIVLTTHYLEEAENFCKNVAIINHGNIVEHTTIKSLIAKLDIETFIFDLKKPQTKALQVDGYDCQMIDTLTMQVDISKKQNLNDLFRQLSEQGIELISMRNKSNRLEELFIKLLGNHNAKNNT